LYFEADLTFLPANSSSGMTLSDKKPRILISNDDGVNAPGLRALAHELHASDVADFAVCGPVGERSAQSHCITIGKHLHAFNIDVEGAQEAYAVDGTPADSVMLALQGPLLHDPRFDCVISGINRGDNLGLHVIYSGTVGAAREAACKGVPAIAFSLADHTARTVGQYTAAGRCSVAIIKAALPLLPFFEGYVINVNFPPNAETDGFKGLKVCAQGEHCSWPEFKECGADPHIDFGDHFEMGNVTLRAFRNAAGLLRADDRPGTDSAAVSEGWVSITPIGLRSDLPLNTVAAKERINDSLVAALQELAQKAAAELGLEAGSKNLEVEANGVADLGVS
jgi:5'-nucleotidase